MWKQEWEETVDWEWAVWTLLVTSMYCIMTPRWELSRVCFSSHQSCWEVVLIITVLFCRVINNKHPFFCTKGRVAAKGFIGSGNLNQCAAPKCPLMGLRSAGAMSCFSPEAGLPPCPLELIRRWRRNAEKPEHQAVRTCFRESFLLLG